MKTLSKLALCPLLAAIAASGYADNDDYPTLYQAFLGSLQLDDQRAHWDQLQDEQAQVAFPSSILGGGMEAEYAWGGSDTWRWGVNPGGSIAMKSSGTRVSGTIGGDNGSEIRFDIDNGLFLGELHLGAYVRAGLAPSLSAYAGAGPMLMYGKMELENDSDAAVAGAVVVDAKAASDFDVGYYARAGLDYRYARGRHLGLGLRYLSAELDFSDTFGQMDISGPQFVITYTQKLGH